VNQKVIRLMLERLGHQAHCVDGGPQFLAEMEQHGDHYDAVLMDVRMEGMDGLEATRRLRDWELKTQRSPVPILALTADAMTECWDECLAAGMNQFLSKPVRKRDLERALGKAMG
jgi:CheY-like chemotaxis protein